MPARQEDTMGTGTDALGRRRVVITGMGLVSPLGRGVELCWQRLRAGASGLVRLPEGLAPDVPGQVAGLVPDTARDPEGGWDIDAVAPAKELRKMDRFIPLALDAAAQALAQAGWPPEDERARERTACVVGSGIGGFGAIAQAVRTTDSRGAARLSPFTVPSFLANLAAGHVSIRHGLKGPLGTPVTACAASVQALGDGLRLIRSGEADVALCGGTEAAVDRVSLGAFAAAKALSTRYNDRPREASRPFDAGRDGFVMGEGAGALVLESLEHALARGAVPLAEVAAIRRLFGTGSGLAISSTKSATGHLLGAAGAVAAICTVLALREQAAPATLNLAEPDPLAEGLDLVAGSARPMAIEYALVNGFGFGGVNASLLL